MKKTAHGLVAQLIHYICTPCCTLIREDGGAGYRDHEPGLPPAGEEHYTLRGGVIVGMKNGAARTLEEKAVLEDGSVLHPNGLILWSTAEPRVLEEGEAVTLDGRLYNGKDFGDALDSTGAKTTVV